MTEPCTPRRSRGTPRERARSPAVVRSATQSAAAEAALSRRVARERRPGRPLGLPRITRPRVRRNRRFSNSARRARLLVDGGRSLFDPPARAQTTVAQRVVRGLDHEIHQLHVFQDRQRLRSRSGLRRAAGRALASRADNYEQQHPRLRHNLLDRFTRESGVLHACPGSSSSPADVASVAVVVSGVRASRRSAALPRTLTVIPIFRASGISAAPPRSSVHARFRRT